MKSHHQLALTRILLFVLAIAASSCASRRGITDAENPIVGAWLFPKGSDASTGRTVQNDTIDWAAVRDQLSGDVVKWNHDLDQSVRFKANGKGVLRDAARGRVRFTYSCECDASRAFAQLVDSAGYYVDTGSPLIPCVVHIGDAVYELLREPDVPLRDTVGLSRQLRVGRALVSEQYFFIVRKSD